MDERRIAREHRLERGDRSVHRGVLLPFDAPGARGVAHVQAAVRRVDREHRARLRRPRDAVLVGARGNRHRVFAHQRANVGGIGVAQQQVGDLMVEQRIDATFGRGHDAMEHHRADPPLGRIVVAVGVPADRAIRVRDVLAAASLAGDGHLAHAVVVGEPVAIEAREPELRAEPSRNCLVGRARGTRVDDHVGDAATREHRRAFGVGQRPRVADFDDQCLQVNREMLELSPAPALVGPVVVRIERIRRLHAAMPGCARCDVGHHSPRVAAAARDRRGDVSVRPAMARVSSSTASGASLSITCDTAHVCSCSSITAATLCPRQRMNV